jgi:hypothetical protein
MTKILPNCWKYFYLDAELREETETKKYRYLIVNITTAYEPTVPILPFMLYCISRSSLSIKEKTQL